MLEGLKDKAMQKMMKAIADPKVLLGLMLESLENLELNIKVHGIRVHKDTKEKRLWISLLIPEDFDLPDLEKLAETETSQSEDIPLERE